MPPDWEKGNATSGAAASSQRSFTLALGWLTEMRGGADKKESRMSIVIQQADTRRFLAEDGAWVPDPHAALTFSDTRRAMDYCRRHTFEPVRLIVFFQNRKVSLLLYVPGSNVPAPAGAVKVAA